MKLGEDEAAQERFLPKRTQASVEVSRSKRVAPAIQSDNRRGFGRGSAVREYWLERCQGFAAVDADGQPLGRVKRVEMRVEGTFLRLTGLRAREVPVDAIETVWPSASVLTISTETAGAGSRDAAAIEQDAKRATWEDETLPWWELFAEGVPAIHSSTASGTGRRLLPSAASARSTLGRRANAVATRGSRLIDRSRTLIGALRVATVRYSVRASRAVLSAAARGARGLARARRRARQEVARKLFALATWVAPSPEAILSPDPQDGRGEFEDEDTAEIARRGSEQR